MPRNLLEVPNEEQALHIADGTVELRFGSFEVKTLRVSGSG
jgi:hypothetical protein